jgi:hypothetical protein
MSQGITTNASFHRYRISVIATWPESGFKRAAMAAARAALQQELAFERVTRQGGTSAGRLNRVEAETRI